MSLLWAAYRIAAPALGALAPAAGVFTPPAERALWSERLGRAGDGTPCDAWVHAASMGEAAAVPPLLRELECVQPSARFWLTATSRTGRTRLAAGGRPTSLAPIDSPQATRRFLSGVVPQRVFLVETELWPHWLLAARERALPVAVVSARLSERSVRRYRGLGASLRGLVAGLGAVLCQGEADRERWLAIGANPERTLVTGNLKSDGLPRPAADRAAARAALGLDPARPLLVLGSLRPGEARIVAGAWRALPEALRARWQVVGVPRHPAAADGLRAEAAAAGIDVRSGEPPSGGWGWDARTGVLADWYRAADVALVGGSLVPLGGHNPLEPAACGAAVVMGAHHASQREYVRALVEGGGLRVVANERELAVTLAELLGDDVQRARVAAAALAVAEAQRGSAALTVQRLVELGLWAR